MSRILLTAGTINSVETEFLKYSANLNLADFLGESIPMDAYANTFCMNVHIKKHITF